MTQLEKFDLKNIVENPIIVCIGHRRSGKSWLIREIMHTLNKKNVSLVGLQCFSNKFYTQFVQEQFIKEHYSDDDFDNILEKQKDNIRKDVVKNRKKRNTLLVLEDFCDDLIKSKSFKDIIFSCKHYNMSCIMASQSIYSITSTMMEETDYIFLFKVNNSSMKIFWKRYLCRVIDLVIFENICEKYTGDNSCIVLDKRSMSMSTNYNDIIFHYKANDPGEFMFGDHYAANIIQEKFLDWFYKPECKDGTWGINCKLAKSMCV
jgi:hypothetical protein